MNYYILLSIFSAIATANADTFYQVQCEKSTVTEYETTRIPFPIAIPLTTASASSSTLSADTLKTQSPVYSSSSSSIDTVKSKSSTYSSSGTELSSDSLVKSSNTVSSSTILSVESTYSGNPLTINDVTLAQTTKATFVPEQSSSQSTTATPSSSMVSSTLATTTTSNTSSPTSASAPTSASTSTSATASSSSSAFDFASVYLERHNYVRGLMQDTPSLVWNQDIADLSQAYADQYSCNGDLVHSGMRYNGNALGENLALGYDLENAAPVTAWFNEISLYNYSYPYFSDSTGHFTQVVWESTTEVGCGYKYCDEYYGNYVICNYSPPGNVEYVGNVDTLFVANVHEPISDSTLDGIPY